jgi:hypothetical protein
LEGLSRLFLTSLKSSSLEPIRFTSLQAHSVPGSWTAPWSRPLEGEAGAPVALQTLAAGKMTPDYHPNRG